MWPELRRAWLGPLAAGLVVLLFVTACGGEPDRTPDPQGAGPPYTGIRDVLFVDPAKSGKRCTASDPCPTIERALAKSHPGTVIQLAQGAYPSQLVIGPEEGDPIDAGVEIVAARGTASTVELSNVVVRAHDIRLQGVRISGTLRTLQKDAVQGFELRDSEISGGVVLLNGVRGAVVKGNDFRDGLNTDALNVKDGSSDVVIEGNSFFDYRHDPAAPNGDVHVDCIQVFGVRDVVIRANRFDNCAQRGILIQVSPLNPRDTVGVTVVSNAIGDCDEGCQTEDVPFQATGATEGGQAVGEDYRIVNNLIDGFAYVDRVDGLVFANNVLERYFNTDEARLVCSGPGIGPNLVADPGRCPAVAAPDRQGAMQFARSPFRSREVPTVVDAGRFSFADPELAPARDIFGRRPCGPREVGPYELGC